MSSDRSWGSSAAQVIASNEDLRIRRRMASLEESSESGLQVIASNDDLLTEILLRLPIKSLLKFKCVSKHWLSLIADPRFIRRKSLKSDAVSALLWPTGHHRSLLYDMVPLHPLRTSVTPASLTMADLPRRLAIVKSCNGLLLCSSSSSMACIDSECKYYIYNPTTMQFRTLPPRWGEDAGHGMLVAGIDLAFDPSKSQVYKVVCLQSRHYSNDQCQVMIYSSETGLWRASGAPFTASRSVDFVHGVYCNGAIHWVDKSWRASLYFDMDEELVREMPMPHPPLPPQWRRGVQYFGESGGYLHIVAKCQAFMTQLNVYEMERDRSGWFLKFRVDLKGVAQSHDMQCLLRIHMYSPVLCVVRGEKEEDSFLILHVADKVIRYNFRARTHQVICEMNSRSKLIRYHFGRQTSVIISKLSPTIIPGWPYVFQYIESLSRV